MEKGMCLQPSCFLPYGREAQEQAGFHFTHQNTAAGDFSVYSPIYS